MKLCVISHSYVEQPGYLPALWSMAALSGIQLSLITPDKYRGNAFLETAFECPHSLFRAFPVPILLGSRQGTFLYQPFELSRALDAISPDVILHEQEVYCLGAVQIAALASQRSIPLAMFVWENVNRDFSLPRRLLMRFVMRRCNGLIGGSKGTKRLCQDWGYSGPIAIIPQMGVPAVDPNPKIGRRHPEHLQVVFAGRLVPEKGVDCLLRAIARLRSSRVPVRCTIAGDGPERSALNDLARALHITDLVTMAGSMSLNDVGHLLENTDVLVLPSRKTAVWEEQFGRVLIEAMAKATVTVGSRTGAIPEVIGSDTLIFDENDDSMLADRLTVLASDAAYFEQEQVAAFQRVSTFYMNDVLAQERVDFLSGLPVSGS